MTPIELPTPLLTSKRTLGPPRLSTRDINIAVTYRHGHIGYRLMGTSRNTTYAHTKLVRGLVISSQYILLLEIRSHEILFDLILGMDMDAY